MSTIDKCLKETTNYTEEEFLRWKNDTMKKTLNSYYDEYWYDFKEYKALKKDYDKLQSKYDKVKDENKELREKIEKLEKTIKSDKKKLKLLNSKTVKIALKIRALYIKIFKGK